MVVVVLERGRRESEDSGGSSVREKERGSVKIVVMVLERGRVRRGVVVVVLERRGGEDSDGGGTGNSIVRERKEWMDGKRE